MAGMMNTIKCWTNPWTVEGFDSHPAILLFHLLGVFSVCDYRSKTSWWYSVAGVVSGGGGDDDDDNYDDAGYINNHHDVAAGDDESSISQIMAIHGFIMIF